jgi:hypothetical protein
MSVGGGIFAGQAGSSTELTAISFQGRAFGSTFKSTSLDVSFAPGQYFVGLWEYSTQIGGGFSADRVPDLASYLLTGTQRDGTALAPALTYVLIPFTIQ